MARIILPRLRRIRMKGPTASSGGACRVNVLRTGHAADSDDAPRVNDSGVNVRPVHDPPRKKDTTRGCPLVVFTVLTLRAEKRTGTGRPSGVDLLRPKRLFDKNKLCDFNNSRAESGRE